MRSSGAVLGGRKGARRVPRIRLVDGQDVDHEHQGGVAGNGVAIAVGTVTELRRNHQQHLAADRLAHEALDPAVDQLARGEGVRGGRAAVPRGVELLALVHPTGVVDRDVLALFHDGACARQ